MHLRLPRPQLSHPHLPQLHLPDTMTLVRWLEPRTDKAVSALAGERKIMEVKKHWAASIWAMLRLLLGSLLLIWNTFADTRAGPINFYWLIFSLGLGVVIEAFWHILGEFRDRFVITNQRIFRVSGVLGTDRASIPISRILDITVKKPLLGRALKYGHFVFESAAQIQGLNEIRYVGNIDDKEQTLRLAIQGVEKHELFQIAEDDGT
jgi:uncharacterized membrane protein YdbT with pleckstrin-like domain